MHSSIQYYNSLKHALVETLECDWLAIGTKRKTGKEEEGRERNENERKKKKRGRNKERVKQREKERVREREKERVRESKRERGAVLPCSATE